MKAKYSHVFGLVSANRRYNLQPGLFVSVNNDLFQLLGPRSNLLGNEMF